MYWWVWEGSNLRGDDTNLLETMKTLQTYVCPLRQTGRRTLDEIPPILTDGRSENNIKTNPVQISTDMSSHRDSNPISFPALRSALIPCDGGRSGG